MKLIPNLILILVFALSTSSLGAHCQVPCGIYGDELKFGELEQHIETIDKAGESIRGLSEKKSLSPLDHQQLVRWTTNKETHAQKMIDEAANYFLAQRIKPDAENYERKVELLHHIILFSMKTKQSPDNAPVKVLSEKLAAFKQLYLDHSH